MARTTKSFDSSLSKLIRDIDAPIHSCSLDSLRTELNKVLKLQNDFELTEVDLEEKLKNRKQELNTEKQKPADVKARIKVLEDEILKVAEEKNHINIMKSMKLNRKQDLETKIKALSTIKMNSNDERRLKSISNYYKTYKHLTNLRWNYTASFSEALSGYIANKKSQLDWFSVPQKTNHEEAIENMWDIISKASDWSKDI